MCYCSICDSTDCISSILVLTRQRRIKRKTVITGFNTDVEYDGIIYHVQTEDKGLDTPLILSLVYTRGEILASKRVRYDDLIAVGFDEKVLAERVLRQHKLICAAIRAGRLDELKKQTQRDAVSRVSSKRESSPSVPISPPSAPISSTPDPISPPVVLKTTPVEPAVLLDPVADVDGQVTRTSAPLPPLREHRLPPPSQPVQIPALPEHVADPARVASSAGDSIRIALVDEKNYRGGDRVILRVLVESGADERQTIPGAEVIVKILGSTFRPLILQAQSGTDGIAMFNTELPHFRSGRAAILVRATAGRLDAELRRIIQQG